MFKNDISKLPKSPRGVRLVDLPKWRAELAAAPDAFRKAKVNRKWGAA